MTDYSLAHAETYAGTTVSGHYVANDPTETDLDRGFFMEWLDDWCDLWGCVARWSQGR